MLVLNAIHIYVTSTILSNLIENCKQYCIERVSKINLFQ